MKKRNLLILIIGLFFTFLISGCKQEELPLISNEPEDLIEINDIKISVASFEPNIVRVVVTEEFAQLVEMSTNEEGRLEESILKSSTNFNLPSGILYLERTFPYAGKFEKRTRDEKMHLWYDVVFDNSLHLTRAGSDLSQVPGILEVEYRPKTVRIKSDPVPEYLTWMSTNTASPANTDWPFDDPELPRQWHYFNNGSMVGSISGSDINLFPAWKYYTTGSPDVIVAVVDGGIDFEHEDLKDNMWHNPEQSGSLRYGYNFYNNRYLIVPENHGTHVAGTIGAVNNNGKGVSGIAGGDFKKQVPGVKLMSCQIFMEGQDGSGSGSQAIKWSADHGAVISQNSWGYEDVTSIPASDKAAIDYFNKYAGIDENGNQVGPMSGGIVIFAAGNDDQKTAVPAEYEGVVAVSSIAFDYKKSYFSNYGDWVDIAAPGGDYTKGAWIRSTTVGGYGSLQGTSMACPHVSGVAALIVSYYGGPGFTNTALKDKLLDYVTPIEEYNPDRYMGSGLVNAYLSLVGGGGLAPEKITDLSVTSESNRIHFSLTIPSDPDELKPAGIVVYYSKEPFETIFDAQAKLFPIVDKQVGDELIGVVEGLDFETKYYVRANAYDLASNKSVLSDMITVTTKQNNAPAIEPLNGVDFIIRKFEVKQLDFIISDPDQHEISVSLNDNSVGASISMISENRYQIVINGPEVNPGSYSTKIIASDEFGLSNELVINYQILPNNPPVKLKDIDNIHFNIFNAPAVELIATDYFKDEDGEILRYEFVIDDQRVVNVSFSDGEFLITPMNKGLTNVTVIGYDIENKSVSSSFKVYVGDGSNEPDLYPNPVVDVLTILPTQEMDASIKLFNTWGAEVRSLQALISPFVPAKINMSGLPTGVYTVILKFDNNEFKQNVVKR